MTSKLAVRSVQTALDLGVLCAAYGLAFLFRFEFALTESYLKLLFFTLPYVCLLQYLALAFGGVPAMSWRHVGLRETYRVGTSLAVATLVLVALRLGLAEWGGHARFVRIPLGVLAMNFVMAFVGVVGLRVLRRVTAERADRNRVTAATKSKRTLLLGAGSAGSLVAKEVRSRPDLGLDLVGFADDDPRKAGTTIQGIRVLGGTERLPEFIERHGVEQVIITMCSVSSDVLRRLVDRCEAAQRPAKIIPGLYEILGGRVNLSRIRNVTIDDLLGRDVVQLDAAQLADFIGGGRVLVTGAGGSIGSELCRQLHRLGPERLVMLDHTELGLFSLEQDLRLQAEPTTDVVPILCDVRDGARVDHVFRKHRPHVVFHAAAHKHVPLMEQNPGEAIKTNVFGTREVADAAHRHQTSHFVLVSTDKAVNPTSVMGASKRAAELYIQSMAQASSTKYVAVRFGNVLGSNGSVIPTFKKQIARGGPVTVTHPDMRRYFMTIPEASQLVLQAGALGRGGEIFVLDMGSPVKIVDLARDLIRLSGLTERDIGIEFTGVRPGEKLFEELSMNAENLTATLHPKIFIGRIDGLGRQALLTHLEGLAQLPETSSRREVRAALKAIVPELRDPDEQHTEPAHAGDAGDPSPMEGRPSAPPSLRFGLVGK
ncbi:MAG: nucleoside-diphosphate sugar epimerase/dehydratase [Myxococcota bacterium]